MTPFGQRLRDLREQHGRALKDMARALRVSSAYLSALEHGHRAQPKPGFVQQVAAYFNLAWEEVDELKALAELSDPKPSIDTRGLSPAGDRGGEPPQAEDQDAGRGIPEGDPKAARQVMSACRHGKCPKGEMP